MNKFDKKIDGKTKLLKIILLLLFVAVIGVVFIKFVEFGGKKVEEKKVSQVEIIAVGDNLYHGPVIDAGKKADGTYDFRHIYEPIKEEVSKADIAVVNQETILGSKSMGYSGYPIFSTPWEAGKALEATGFDVFTCASNHAMDKGETGLKSMFKFFEQHGNIKELGINKTEEEYNTIDYYEKNGIKFALLNYTYGTNGISQPKGKPWSVNRIDRKKITKDVNEAKKHADMVIVFPHWGIEYNTGISDYQKKYTKLFSDLGVDLVIGSHPHVIEKVEWIENKETGKKMLVYYSLGNFVSNQPDAIMQLGAMAKIKVEKIDDKVSIKEAKAIPIITHVEDRPLKVKVYKLSDYTDELAKKNHSHSSVKYFKNASKKILGEFLEEAS